MISHYPTTVEGLACCANFDKDVAKLSACSWVGADYNGWMLGLHDHLMVCFLRFSRTGIKRQEINFDTWLKNHINQ
jgi:hypothetical protein